MEEKNEINNNSDNVTESKKGNNKIGLVIIVGLLLVGVGVGCFFLGQNFASKNSSNDDNKEESESNKNEDNTSNNDKEEIVISDTTKEKLNTIINKIINCPLVDGDSKLLTNILNGKNGLTDEEKFAIVMRFANTLNEEVTENEVPSELKSEVNHLAKVTYEEYENRYKEIFIDEPIINETTMKKLDMPSSVAYFNKDDKVMYVYTGFGGTCDYDTSFVSYSFVDDNYVVNTNGIYTISGNELSANINWVFDKDLKFIKTEVLK